MGKQHAYKGYIIENKPYINIPRWFISKEGYKNVKVVSQSIKYPCDSLKEAKLLIDNIVQVKVI